MPSNYVENLHFQGYAKFGTHRHGKIDILIKVGLVAGARIWKENITDNLIENLVIADHNSQFILFLYWEVANKLVYFINLKNEIVS